MEPELNLSWILPYVRESLRGRGNLTFDTFVDELMKVLGRANVPSVKESAFPQSTRRQYDLNALHQNIKIAITEAFHYLEQNRFILHQPNDRSLTFTTGGQWLITERGQEWANGVEPLPEDYNGFMKQFGALTQLLRFTYPSAPARIGSMASIPRPIVSRSNPAAFINQAWSAAGRVATG